MSYDPKTATIPDPAARLRRDITLLSDEQKTKVFNEAIDDLPDAEKPGLAAIIPEPIDIKPHEERIKSADDAEKAKAADYVALKLTPEKQAKISELVAKLLKEANEDKEKPKHAAHHKGHHPVGAK